MRAELKRLDSADAPEGLASFRPADPRNFVLPVGAVIGPAEMPSEELFYFTVCTAAWLRANPPEKGFTFLRHYVLLSRWDYSVLERAIGDLCRRTEGQDWAEVAAKLSRYGAWEFEDYRESN